MYLFIMNIFSFFLYKSDKERAERKKWRISEKTLLTLGFIGGGIGALSAMHIFRHKTKHYYFWVCNILGIIVDTAVAVLIFKI
ncbi:MAG: DUF1294 domain-containing protein [Ruminococcus sp.]|nr:DUF1294 domain-containing protein [Ruminococcus sp.]